MGTGLEVALIASLVSTTVQTIAAAATEPDMPEVPEPETPSLAPEEAKRSAEARRRKVRSGGRPSTRLTQPLGGPQMAPPTGATTLTGQ
jgi:hypothetical protein